MERKHQESQPATFSDQQLERMRRERTRVWVQIPGGKWCWGLVGEKTSRATVAINYPDENTQTTKKTIVTIEALAAWQKEAPKK